jgi:hypothetical protein
MRGALSELAPVLCYAREETLIAGNSRIWRARRGQTWRGIIGKPARELIDILLDALRFRPSLILLCFPHLDDMRVRLKEHCLADKLRFDHDDTPLIWFEAYSPVVRALFNDGVGYICRSF